MSQANPEVVVDPVEQIIAKLDKHLFIGGRVRITNAVGDIEYDEQTGKRIYTGIMTREERDLRGNIFRVKGSKIRPGLKFLAQHKLEDETGQGKPTVIGKVLSTFETEMGGVPAIGCTFIFANTCLGYDYEYLYANGFMTDLSTGVIPIDATPITEEKDGVKTVTGYDIKKSEIYEVSAVTFGINKSAKVLSGLGADEAAQTLVMNSLKEGDVSKAVSTLKTLNSVKEEAPTPKVEATPIKNDDSQKLVQSLLEQLTGAITQMTNLNTSVTDLANKVASGLTNMEGRLDELVSSLADEEDGEGANQSATVEDLAPDPKSVVTNGVTPGIDVDALRQALRDLQGKK